MELAEVVMLNVRVPRELAARVRMHAVVTGKPMQALVAEALEKAVPIYKLQPKGK